MALFEMVQTLILRFDNMEKMDQFAKFKHANISNFTVYELTMILQFPYDKDNSCNVAVFQGPKILPLVAISLSSKPRFESWPGHMRRLPATGGLAVVLSRSPYSPPLTTGLVMS